MQLVAKLQLAFLLCLLFFLGVVKISTAVSNSLNDLLMHFLAYMVLMCSGLFTFPHRVYAVKLFYAFFAYSILIEFTQFFLPYRSFSLLDIVANGAGLLVGVSLGLLLLPVFKSLHVYGR